MVHSNEMACRKMGRLGLDPVIWISSPGLKLAVSKVEPLGKVINFSVKYTVHGDSLIFFDECFEIPVIVS